MSPQLPGPTTESSEKASSLVFGGKLAEAQLGCDGGLVAHAKMVVACREAFDKAAPASTHAPKKPTADPKITGADLLFIRREKPGHVKVTAEGVRSAAKGVITYIYNWIHGRGAININDTVEDLATAEISRSLLWQWIKYGVMIENGPVITLDLVKTSACEVTVGREDGYNLALKLMLEVLDTSKFLDFLPTLLYQHITSFKARSKL